ncbi:hypothetical protein H4C80_07655 [Pseudomonas juntendi]|uniref:Uncharacterized protein n=1 Tax=Pseudomonas juntendi TaxID=2666183 RepID=A0A7W2KEF0_9PSED|nr:hypothetical protein [Pseudomonas juntendi]MBA6097006.1 hypothetical protein [Pseudomonas juntendi]
MNGMSKQLSASEKVRQNFRLLKARSKMFADLADLQIDPSMLADPVDHTVFSKFLIDKNENFVLSVPHWAFTETDKLRIEHSRDGTTWTTLHEETINFFEKPIANPYPVTLDTTLDEMKLNGVHHFRSWVMNDAEEHSSSRPLTLIFDTEPPYGNSQPLAFPSIPPVTDKSLEQADDKVQVILPGYEGWMAKDRVLVYWLTEVPDNPEDLINLAPVATVDTTGEDQVIEIQAAKVIEVGDGGVYALYVLLDKAGNISRPSLYTPVAVALGPLPVAFDDPEVPLATDADGHLIDQADAMEGVEVWVPVYENAKPDDHVTVSWGATPLAAERVGSAPGEYVRVAVPAAVLLGAYSGTGPKETTVAYIVQRGTHEAGGADTTVFVDFETLDPDFPGPDWPDPTQPDLTPLAVNGRGGTSEENQLDRADADKPVDLKVLLADFIQVADVLTFYWADQKAAVHTIIEKDVTDGEVTVEIAWSVVERGGNRADLPAHYVVNRPEIHNPVHSQITRVEVDGVVIIPQVPVFQHLSSSGLINCQSIKDSLPHADGPAVVVSVPDLTPYQQFGPFTQVRMDWWVYRGRSDEQGFEIVDEVTLQQTIPIDTDHPITGFTWRVPWETNVEPSYEGSEDPNLLRQRANATYTLLGEKDPLTSETAKVQLAFVPPSGQCTPT